MIFFPYSNNGSFEASCSTVKNDSFHSDGAPAKRLKVSDINISRYDEEFLEIREIASGTFGTVKVARHRLDGMVYAIKVSLMYF